jgi:hypothetical protein
MARVGEQAHSKQKGPLTASITLTRPVKTDDGTAKETLPSIWEKISFPGWIVGCSTDESGTEITGLTLVYDHT